MRSAGCGGGGGWLGLRGADDLAPVPVMIPRRRWMGGGGGGGAGGGMEGDDFVGGGLVEAGGLILRF